MRAGLISKISALGIFAFGAAALPTTAYSASPEGRFAVEGVGLLTCQEFLEAEQTDPPRFAQFAGWISGYITGANHYEVDTFDVTPWQTPQVVLTIFKTHCQTNKDERFVEVVQKFVATLLPSRLKNVSPTLTVTVDDQSTRLYEETLKRAQERLSELGFYSDKVDGVFGRNTQEAIATFQLTEGLPATGLPDTLTLWRLLAP